MTSFSWLHLSDLHRGMKEQHWLWPGVREMFFEDLKRLHDRYGPWDLVLFTGDLTQRGSAGEFQKVDELLEQLWAYFEQLGSSPVLLAIPGNHDLVRPNRKNPVVKLLQQWTYDIDIQQDFWEETDSLYRQTIVEAFENYVTWWEKQPFKVKEVTPGILPGDFSATFEKDGAKLGILGLNTSFLQLTDDDYEGRLALHTRQFHAACRGDGPAWTKKHHTCLLLTHHPPAWLNPNSQQHLYEEIVAHGRFTAHLCGHMHETAYRDIAEGGTETRRIWQAPSLFGLEYFDEKRQRLHGYGIGRIDLSGNRGALVFWPREARLQGRQRKIVPDYSLNLTDDQYTIPREFKLLRPYIMQEIAPIHKVDERVQDIPVEDIVEVALSYAEKGDYARAIELYEQKLEKFPEDIDLLIKLSDAYRYSQQYMKAIEGYVRVLELQEEFPEALEGLALTYAEIGDFKSSDVYFQQYISRKRGDILNVKLQATNRKRQELYQNEMMAALGQMASGMAHEFNTPLQAIKFIAQSTSRFIDKGKVEHQEIKANLRRIVDVVNTMANQVKHIQALAKDDQVTTEMINLNQVITSAFEFFNQQLKNRSITVNLDLYKNLPEIKANKYRVEQIFINLIQNSRDALEPIKNREKEITVRTDFLNRTPPSLLIYFGDTGIGIKEADKHRIFEPFFTTKDTGTGMGLGLSIVREIVTELDGTIRLFEESSVGTTFIIEIPLKEQGDEKNGKV